MQQHVATSLRTATRVSPRLLDRVSAFSLQRVAPRWIAQLASAERNLQETKARVVYGSEKAIRPESSIVQRGVGASPPTATFATPETLWDDLEPEDFEETITPKSTAQSPSNPDEAAQRTQYLHLRSLTSSLPQSSRTLRYLRTLHDASPHLRTTQSYNLLINYAIRAGLTRHAESLLAEMLEAAATVCPPNVYTWRLRIRLLMAKGEPKKAARLAAGEEYKVSFGSYVMPAPTEPGMPSSDTNEPRIPFGVWAQLLRPGTRRQNHITPISPKVPKDDPFYIPPDILFDPSLMPNLSTTALRETDYRTVADLVAYLRAHRQSKLARSLILAWVSSLVPPPAPSSPGSPPLPLTPIQLGQISHVLARHLHTHHPTSSSPRTLSHPALVRLIDTQLDLLRSVRSAHPSFVPDPILINQLMRVAKVMRNPGHQVGRLVRVFEKGFGVSLCDSGFEPGRANEAEFDSDYDSSTAPRADLFAARTTALRAILKDSAPYRSRDLAFGLFGAQELTLAIGKPAASSHTGEKLRGQDVSKYILAKGKAVRGELLSWSAMKSMEAAAREQARNLRMMGAGRLRSSR